MRLEGRNLVLLAVLTGLLALDLLSRGEELATGGADSALLPELLGVPAWRITIEEGAESLEVVRRPQPGPDPVAEGAPLGELDLGPWLLPASLDHPADPEAVSRLLGRLRSLRTLDLVADSSRDSDYGLLPGAEGQVRVTVRGAESSGRRERVLADVLLGLSDGGVVHVRRTDGERILRAAGFPTPAASAAAWLDPGWTPVRPGWVQSLTVTVAGSEPASAVRTGLDRWSDRDGGRVPAAGVRGLLADLLALRPVEVLGEGSAESIAEWELELELELEGAGSVLVRFGGEDGTGRVPAAWNDGPRVVAVGAAAYHALLERARALTAP